MLNSFEVRWIFQGKLPDNMLQWVETFAPEEQSIRTDYYFNKTENGTLGIKLREGSIQMKPLLKEVGHFTFNDHKAKIESYSKWSYLVQDNQEWSYMIEEPETWLPVTKSRLMNKYTLAGGYPDRVEMKDRVEQGCEMELSNISILNKDFWTLAFEAYGKEAEVNLQKTLRYVFETSELPQVLPFQNSFGYAQLIHDIQH
ncbi:hypothetical protein [Fulvivirga sediminis]|uniref:CYTH domain-containing protein n=1 Tax=Fulvivirga sediminis TaxID=2803949 RepID=A0A937FA82_9BACT|nr:hypothetical protein [Fulvivirga sediminis]MBL3657847.1 hypothetical protein [Fulvivirga sediminis]